jgi:hypothetical protein
MTSECLVICLRMMGSDEMPSVSSGSAAVEASRTDEVIKGRLQWKAGTALSPPILVAILRTIYAI